VYRKKKRLSGKRMGSAPFSLLLKICMSCVEHLGGLWLHKDMVKHLVAEGFCLRSCTWFLLLKIVLYLYLNESCEKGAWKVVRKFHFIFCFLFFYILSLMLSIFIQ
jgi:hypothetical protein